GPLQQEDAAPPAQLEPRVVTATALEATRLDRVALLRSRLRGGAEVADGADQAARRARDADRRAEIHQALRVRPDAALRQQRRRRLPQFALGTRLGEVAGEGEHAGEHALDVPVEDRGALAERERGDRRGGRAADAGQRRELFARARELGPVLGDDRLCGAVEHACPAVVAEPAPEREHVVERRGGERADIGEAGDEALEVAEHGGDLRLLQHHLGEPDAVRIVALPGQVVAAVLALPGNNAAGEPRRQRAAPAQAWRCNASSAPTGTASSKRGRSSSSV